MLAPHDGENPKLGEIRLASEDFLDLLKFLRRQAMLRDEEVTVDMRWTAEGRERSTFNVQRSTFQ
jgi:hypothetical protein